MPHAAKVDPSAAVPKETLFSAGDLRALRLTLDDAAHLQQFFDDNPNYFLSISGHVARPDTAHEQLAGDVPAELSHSGQSILAFLDSDQGMVAVVDVVSDLLMPGVWHIGLFMVASIHHGRGVGSELYLALEGWMQAQGARWIRLGVVIGNQTAERFWTKHGFIEVRVRHGVKMEHKVNDVRVMVKPLGRNALSEYRALVLRDHPDSA